MMKFYKSLCFNKSTPKTNDNTITNNSEKNIVNNEHEEKKVNNNMILNN